MAMAGKEQMSCPVSLKVRRDCECEEEAPSGGTIDASVCALLEPRSPCPGLALMLAIDASVYRRRAVHEISVDVTRSPERERVGEE